MDQVEIGRFILDTPLFKKHDITKIGVNILDVLFFNGSIDCFCPKCKNHSVYLGENNDTDRSQNKANMSLGLDTPGASKKERDLSGIYLLDFHCPRNKDHKLHFILKIDGQKLIKIGQSPSPLEITGGDLKQYEPLLGDFFPDLNSSVILYSNAFGVGAFTHLRRIVENYFMKEAMEAWERKKHASSINYNELRFKEKVTLLKDYLPNTFTDNPTLYRIISSGIHSLSENQCLAYFPALRDCILLCLEEKLSDIKKQKMKDSVKKSLSDINVTIGKINA